MCQEPGNPPKRRSSRTGTGPSWAGHDLLEALRLFREFGLAAVRDSDAAALTTPLLEAACQVVSAILGGIHEQLQDIRADIEVRTHQNSLSQKLQKQDLELVILEVEFATASPLVGEIATRSRVASNVLIAGGRLRFALQSLPEKPQEQPLGLTVNSFELQTLPDLRHARKLMQVELGESMGMMTAYNWWQQHRHTWFPLESSKFHRIVESFLEQSAVKMLGQAHAAYAFWSYLNAPETPFKTFLFHHDRRARGGIAVTAAVEPPKNSAEAELLAQQRSIVFKENLESHRTLAERVCASGLNLAAMLFGPEVGQHGGSPERIAKLFSSAKHWGPGEDGWHRWDETWLCTDTIGPLGIVIQEQGRIIWRSGRMAEEALKWDEGHRPSVSSPVVAEIEGAESDLFAFLGLDELQLGLYELQELLPGKDDVCSMS